MRFTARREKRLWGGAGACLALIYGSAFVARPIAEFLRDRDFLRITVAVLFSAALVVIGRWVIRSRPQAHGFISLAVIARFYHLLFFWTILPEERLHVLEYALLAGLIYSALVERQENSEEETIRIPRMQAMAAMLTTALCGWGDEGIQSLLPDRFYDVRDIAINAVAGILAVLACMAWLPASGKR